MTRADLIAQGKLLPRGVTGTLPKNDMYTYDSAVPDPYGVPWRDQVIPLPNAIAPVVTSSTDVRKEFENN